MKQKKKLWSVLLFGVVMVLMLVLICAKDNCGEQGFNRLETEHNRCVQFWFE
ncbi:MAG: hypothetical protein ACK5LR_05630 [Mangrovibacterium sp.]